MFRVLLICIILFTLEETFVFSSQASEKKIEAERSGHWSYYCIKEKGMQQCEIARKIKIDEQNETFLIVYRITKDASSNLQENLNIIVPSRANTKKSLQLTFDEKTKFSKSFLKCIEQGCLAVFKGGMTLKYSLKNFSKMKITFYVLDDAEPISITLQTEGFKEAINVVSQRLNLG